MNLSDGWFVCFMSLEQTEPKSFKDKIIRFFLKRLKAGYQHCFLMKVKGEGVIIIDWTLINMNIEFCDIDTALSMVRGRIYDYIEISPRTNETSNIKLYLTCVQVIKHILGVNAFNVFTPWQLCKHLRRIK